MDVTNKIMSYKILGFELVVMFGGVTLGFIEELNMILRTIGLFVSIVVGLLTAVKLIRDFKRNRKPQNQ